MALCGQLTQHCVSVFQCKIAGSIYLTKDQWDHMWHYVASLHNIVFLCFTAKLREAYLTKSNGIICGITWPTSFMLFWWKNGASQAEATSVKY